MKRTIFTLLGCAALMLPATGFEKRTFKSADSSKTFEGVLTDFDIYKDTDAAVKVKSGDSQTTTKDKKKS